MYQSEVPVQACATLCGIGQGPGSVYRGPAGENSTIRARIPAGPGH